MNKILQFLILFSLYAVIGYGQNPNPGVDCSSSAVLCNPNASFPASTNVDNLGAVTSCGGSGNCPSSCMLNTTPNPASYIFSISEPGDLEFDITTDPPVDVDFAMWGPFTSPDGNCGGGNFPPGAPIDCSYSCLLYTSPSPRDS